MNKQLSSQASFSTIAEAAMLAPLPLAYKEDLRSQIIGFVKWINSVSGIEEKYEQLELDLKEKKNEQQLSDSSQPVA